jgi:hypothetical protein
MNGRHKAALIFAGYRWVEAGHGLSTHSLVDGDGVYMGAVSQTEEGGRGWMVELFGHFEVCIRETGQTRYPTRKAAMRALEGIACQLFAAGFKLYSAAPARGLKT